MNKVSKLLAILLLAVSVMFAFASCKEEDDISANHQHTAAQAVKENEKSPTCTADGSYDEVVYCSGCGTELSREAKISAAFGHSIGEYVSDGNATCTEDGTKTKSCLNGCGYEETVTDIGSALGHSATELEFTGETCNGNPIAKISCGVCGEYIGEYGHKYEKNTNQPTCTENGRTVYTCSACSYSYSEEIRSQGHVTSGWVTTTEPTCYESGVATKTCLACGEVAETKEITPIPHSYTSTLSGGRMVYTCRECSHSYSENVEKTTYEITFAENGGSEAADMTVFENAVPELPLTYREGYIFVGWYSDADLTEVYAESLVTEDMTLYARWEKIEILTDDEDIVKGAPVDYTFTVVSGTSLNDSNVNGYVVIKNLADETLTASVVSLGEDKYEISCAYEEGTNYFVTLSGGVTFDGRETDSIWIITEGEKENVLVLKDGVASISLDELFGTYESEAGTVLLAYSDILNVGDVAVFYEGDEENYRYGVKITAEGELQGYVSYVVEEVSIDELFDECEVSYSGKIDFTNAELNQNLSEELEAAFLSSDVYNQYVEAVSVLSSKFGSKMGKPSFNIQFVAKGETLTLKLGVRAEMQSGVVFTMDYYIDLEFDLDFTEAGNSTTLLLTTDMTNTLRLNVEFDGVAANGMGTTSQAKLLAEFRELFNEIKERNMKLNPSAESDGTKTKSFKLGTIPLKSGAVTVNLDLTAEFEFAMMGGVSAELVHRVESEIGLKKGEFVSDYKAELVSVGGVAYTGVDVFGGIGVSLNVSCLGITAYVKGTVGLHGELVASAVLSVNDKDNYILGTYYLESKVLMNIRVGLNLWGYDMSDSKTVYEKPYTPLGNKTVYLHFVNEEYPSVSEALDLGNLDCGTRVPFINYINNSVLTLDAGSFSAKTKNVTCNYTADVVSGNINVTVSRNGNITVCGSGSFTVRVTVKYGDILEKQIYVKGSVAHDFSVEKATAATLRSLRTCYAPATYYYSCSGCYAVGTEEYFEYGGMDNHSLEYRNDGEYHWQTCVNPGCKYVTEKVEHSGTAATCQKLAKCKTCDAEYGTILPHDEAKKVTTAYYLASVATCKEAAKYYYSCSMCGLIGKTTFAYGNPTTNHSYNNDFACGDRICLVCEKVAKGNGNHTDIGGGVCGCNPDAFINGMLLVDNGDGTFNVSSYIGSASVVEIPAETKDGDPIVGISADTFKNKTQITTVIIPDSIKTIGNNAFYGCTSLNSLTIPEGVTSIGTYAFYNCKALTSIEYNAASVGDFASDANVFTNAGSSAGGINLTIGAEVTAIPAYSFTGANVATLTFESGSVCASIGKDAFKNCTNLSNVYLNGNLASWCAFSFDGSDSPLYYADKLYLDGAELTELTIPDGVTSIGNYAFYGCSDLTKVTIPASVTSIGNSAFEGCVNLESVIINGNVLETVGNSAFKGCYTISDAITLPKTIKTIGDSAFYGCVNLSGVEIPRDSALTYLGSYAFYNCENISAVNIPDGVTSIGDSTFSGCNDLSSVAFSENSNLTTISGYAFYKCVALKSILIPKRVTTIGVGAFTDCEGLVEIKFNATSMSDCQSANIFDNAGNSASGLALKVGANVTVIPAYLFGKSNVTEIIFEENGVCAAINSRAFSNCTSLTSVTIPDSVISIGNGAFSGCTGLESITIPFVGATKGGTENIHFGYIFGASSYSNNSSYVPSSLKTVEITEGSTIGKYAFYRCTSLTSVTIPDSVTSIGSYAFYNCSSLESVTIADSVTSIGDYAFSSCSSLTSVTIPDSVKSIGNYTFSGCRSLTSVTIPNSVTSIGEYVFSGCSSLTSVTIPNSVTSIGDEAFYNCYSLTSVMIPNSVTSIGIGAFKGCSSLKRVTIGNSVTRIGGYAFQYCDSLTSVTIPNSVTSIGSEAFRYCYKLVEVINKSSLNIVAGSSNYGYVAYYAKEVHNGESKIVNKDDYLFYTYKGVNYLLGYVGDDTALVLPESYNGENCEIYQYAFSNCDSLTSVTIGNSVTSIGDRAFEDCDSLTSVMIGNGVTSIGSSAFYGCYSLTNVTIPDSVTSIGGSAFSYCSSLTSVTIGNSVTSIGYAAFYYCSSLTRVYITDLAKWCEIDFGGYDANPLYYAKNLYLDGELVTELVIPEGVTSIGDYAFAYCTSLKSVTIPDSVTSIGFYAFEGCSSLTRVYITDLAKWCEIDFGGYDANPLCYAKNLYLDGELVTELVIPEGVTSIGSVAFSWCSSLTSVTIPDSVTSIGNYAFYYCSSLTSVTIPNSVTSIGGSTFSGCPIKIASIPTNAISYVPRANLETVVITGGTSIYNGAFSGCTSLTSVTIGNSVTSIGSYAFYNCSSLTSVTIGNSVTSIGNSAFYDCTGLTSIDIPNCVTSIGDWAFEYCTSLTSITIPNSVTSIGDWAFSGCYKLVEVINKSSLNIVAGYGFVASYAKEVHNGESKIVNKDDYLFYTYNGVNYLLGYVGDDTALVLPESYNGENYEIYKYAFAYCHSLTSITIPDSVTSIGYRAFEGCSSLKSVTIGNSVTSIGDVAFYGCANLEFATYGNCKYLGNEDNPYLALIETTSDNYSSYTIHEDTKLIAGSAFSNCERLTSISIPDSVTSIGDYAFSLCSSLTSVTIPDSVTSIGDYAFVGCSSLTSVTIPNSVTSIGYRAFRSCDSLESITVSEENPAYKSIDENLYTKDGKTLVQYAIGKTASSFVIPNSVTSIGNYAFYDCSSLTSVTIPDSVTSIGDWAFYYCSSLTDVYYTGSGKEWAEISIGSENTYLTNATIHYNYEEN